MCDPRIVNLTLDLPGQSMLSISGNDCNVYWLGDPDETMKNNIYHQYANLLHSLADAVEQWTEE